MLTLPNVTTQDGYTTLCTLGPVPTAQQITYVVANAAVVAQMAPLLSSGTVGDWGDEVLLTPQANAIQRVGGIRFRSAVAGVPAQVVAQLIEPADPVPGAGTPFTQRLSPSGSVTVASDLVIDPRAYGAVGDGIHDDAPGIRAAIAACPRHGVVGLEIGLTWNIGSVLDVTGYPYRTIMGIYGGSGQAANHQLGPCAKIIANGLTSAFYGNSDVNGSADGLRLENLYVTGAYAGAIGENVAGWQFDNFGCDTALKAGVTTPALAVSNQNAAVVLNNAFTCYFDRCALNAANFGLPSVVMRGLAGGARAAGTYLVAWRNCIFGYGGIMYSQETATTAIVGHWVIDNCYGENFEDDVGVTMLGALLGIQQTGAPGAWALRTIGIRNWESYDRMGGTDVLIDLNAANVSLIEADLQNIIVGGGTSGNSIRRRAGSVSGPIRMHWQAGRVVDAGGNPVGPYITQRATGLDFVSSAGINADELDLNLNAGGLNRYFKFSERYARLVHDATGERWGDGAADTVRVLRLAGSGTPEGVVTAPVGSVFHRWDGAAGTCLYVKESGVGNVGWVGK